MNSFNINRFGKTLRWVVGVNFRSLLMWTIGYTVAVFLFEHLFFVLSPAGMMSNALHNISQFCSIFILIALVVGLSAVFYGMNKKARREAFLMLPASNLEKFLSAVLYATIIWGACVVLSYVAGDTLRMVFRAWAYGDAWTSTVPLVLNTFKPLFVDALRGEYSIGYMVINTVVIGSFIVWIHSLYILGGTLLRKYSFVASTLVLILFVWIMGWLTGHFHLKVFYGIWVNDRYYGYVGPLAYVLAVILPLFAVFNYWATYRVFKGMQLITNKWTNYDIH